MVVTQLQLKWPDHSTHLLTGLKYLFKNEQLVDCTLKCNKNTLKVHRSVLAACSPYFERELENNPLIVIKDMQFNVLQALIEFMYYGETLITEENLTSLVEAAKLFQIKGLSEMDLLTSNENNVISPADVNKNCTVESSCISGNIEDIVFENVSPLVNSVCKSQIQEAISNNMIENSTYDSEDSNSNIIVDNAGSHVHSRRNFVVTPPQTESAQILLSLARSYSQKHYLGSQTGDIISSESDLLNEKSIVDQKINNNIIFNEHDLLMKTNNLATPSSEDVNVKSLNNEDIEQQLTKPNLPEHKLEQNDGSIFSKYNLLQKYNGDIFTPSAFASPIRTDSNKSILAELLTKDCQTDTAKSSQFGENYNTLYVEEETDHINKNQNNTVAFDKSKNLELQAGIILDCPFLIETSDGYVSVDNMLTVFESGEIFDSSGSKTFKVIPKEEVIPPVANVSVDKSEVCCSTATMQVKQKADPDKDALLERIKADSADELRDDPEAVVLSRVTDDGKLEKYVLSSADIKALKEMNDLRKNRRHTFDTLETSHSEVESSLSQGDASLFTHIINCGARVENAISRLPFKKSVRSEQSSVVKDESNCASMAASIVPSTSVTSERILADATLTVDAHHHENMFEELDNQFNMDCSIENIQREYVAYEEASKNETQLEHNYYANAMKDEDEECVVINENYDLRTIMMIGESLENSGDTVGESLIALSSTANLKTKNTNMLQAISAADVYLNDSKSQKKEMVRNGFVEKGPNIFNGKCDLIFNNDALVSSMLNVTSETKTTRMTNGSARSCKPLKSNNLKRSATRCCFDNANTLPFKSVKSTSTTRPNEKKPKRTYKRKPSSSTAVSHKKRNENSNVNGVVCAEDCLVEEIIVDEIS